MLFLLLLSPFLSDVLSQLQYQLTQVCVKEEGSGGQEGRVKLRPLFFASITFFLFLHMNVVAFYIRFSKLYTLWF